MLRRLCLLAGSIFFMSGIFAQDVHFTQFTALPTSLNPGLAGSFYGTYRISGIYRNQWFAGIQNANGSFYKTPGINLEVNILKGLRKQDWISIGLGLVSDVQGFQEVIDPDSRGSGAIRTTLTHTGAAYHFALDEKQRNVLTLGVQFGQISQRIVQSQFIFENDFSSSPNPDPLAEGKMENQDKLDLNAGLALRGLTASNTRYELGVGMFHINNQQLGGSGQDTSRIDNSDVTKVGTRLAVHGLYEIPISERLSVAPKVLFQTIKGYNELVAQGVIGYDLKKKVRLYGGLGYRFGDALQVLAGMDFNRIKVGVGYDMALSALRSASTIELSVSYLGFVYKKAKSTPVIFCPRF